MHDVGFGGDTAAALRSIRAPTLLLVPKLDLYNPSKMQSRPLHLSQTLYLSVSPRMLDTGWLQTRRRKFADIPSAISGFLARCIADTDGIARLLRLQCFLTGG